MRPITLVVGPLAAAAAANIASAQTVPAGGSVAINGPAASSGVATLDAARRVAITSAGNDSGIAFTISGLDRYGIPQSEVVPGANAGSVSSALDYAQVISVVPSGATAGTVTVGTTAVASSSWARLDEWSPPPLSLSVVTTGTVSYIVEQSFDDPNNPTNPVAASAMAWFPLETSSVSGVFTTSNAPLFLRMTLTSGTGSARAVAVQYGAGNINIDIAKS